MSVSLFANAAAGKTAEVESELGKVEPVPAAFKMAKAAADVALKHQRWETLAYLADFLLDIENTATMGTAVIETEPVVGGSESSPGASGGDESDPEDNIRSESDNEDGADDIVGIDSTTIELDGAISQDAGTKESPREKDDDNLGLINDALEHGGAS